ncbi:hypothetical protein OIU76_026262 [Salix suchowensis]|nr:hypothetical protein OIU76_026262 [Salix suchowensis]
MIWWGHLPPFFFLLYKLNKLVNIIYVYYLVN